MNSSFRMIRGQPSYKPSQVSNCTDRTDCTDPIDWIDWIDWIDCTAVIIVVIGDLKFFESVTIVSASKKSLILIVPFVMALLQAIDDIIFERGHQLGRGGGGLLSDIRTDYQMIFSSLSALSWIEYHPLDMARMKRKSKMVNLCHQSTRHYR